MNYISPPHSQPTNLFAVAVRSLRDKGHVVEPSDMIGLTLVDGRELTMGQVISVAMQS